MRSMLRPLTGRTSKLTVFVCLLSACASGVNGTPTGGAGGASGVGGASGSGGMPIDAAEPDAPTACTPPMADCDGNPANGCETNLHTIGNCGACGVVCSRPNGQVSCATGTCTLDGCLGGFGDCDQSPSNGCETPLNTNSDCGGCGNPCDIINASETCVSGQCTFIACNAGFADCDGNQANGCETSLTSTTNCGGCGQICNLPNAASSCATGACTLTACNAGFGNCDGNDGNGCETPLTTTQNCGACGQVCNLPNAAVSCATGSCSPTACNPGYGDCDGNAANGCETPLNTNQNCGGCGFPCNLGNATSSCASGSCMLVSCNPGFGDCDGNSNNGCETPLGTTANCGGCGVICDLANASESCPGGQCTLGACNAGFGNCDNNPDNGCETSLSTVANCGSCGVQCNLANATSTCPGGQCTLGACNAGFGNCDSNGANGCETPLNTNSNCGGCGFTCQLPNASASCATGTCTLTGCNGGFANCDGIPGNGCETPLGTTSNCGACGVSCSNAHGGTACTNGVCAPSCAPGFADCDGNPNNGCETPLNTDNNCGGCGVICSRNNGTASCASGSCQLTGCNAPFANCDGNDANGCEANLASDVNHCGTCGTQCTNQHGSTSCVSGTCTPSCISGFQSCDGNPNNGCETSTTTNTDCGGCGVPCSRTNGSASCATGSCQLTGCNAPFANCDGIDSNGCETNTSNDASHCGSCTTQCTNANGSTSCSNGNCAPVCNPGFQSCDGNPNNGCETPLNTNSNCGGCGIPCSRANAAATCATGACQIASCNPGFDNCDGNDPNGCEVSHGSYVNSCASATNFGTHCGDLSCNLFCGSTSFQTFGSASGRQSQWFHARNSECSSCCADIYHHVSLAVPAGVTYDMCIYFSCGGAPTCYGPGTINVFSGDDCGGSDNSFDYWIEIRYISGSSCGNWTLTVDGTNC